MLTTKNWPAARACIAGLLFTCLAAMWAGCTPAGPRALLDGERFLREGKPAQAVPRLQRATQLLPGNAQAWNHLGLAYHKSGQPAQALKAYEQARRCDLNLTPVRYNLGCLLLEQNNPQAAIAEFTAFTLLERDSADGWLKLGTAQLRTRQWALAEKSLQNAARLRPDSPEVWNALGVVYTQRGRPKDAWNSFAAALQKQPGYPPAVLNQAVFYHQSGKNPELALQKYLEYFRLKPTPSDVSSVAPLIRQLQSELAPQAAPRVTNAVMATPASGSPAGATSSIPRVASSGGARELTNIPPVRASLATPDRVEPATNVALASNTTAPRTEVVPPARTETAPPRQVQTAAPPKVTPEPRTETLPSKPEVVQLAEEPPPKPAQDRSGSEFDSTLRAAPETQPQSVAVPPLVVRRDNAAGSESPKEKRSLVSRLNPTTWFRGKPQGAVRPTPLDPIAASPVEPATEVTAPDAEPAPVVLTPQPPLRRYTYRSPAKPAPGDRVQAEAHFARAVEAHRERRLDEAIEAYRQTIRLDPSFFEAQYNLGLAAYELRRSAESLAAYETALSINPTSENARYNFAIALQMDGYYQDAALELEKLLEQRPEEVRAHFSLAGLYAEKLYKSDLARSHYRRVLDLQPHHGQAAAIRYWLAANP